MIINGNEVGYLWGTEEGGIKIGEWYGCALVVNCIAVKNNPIWKSC